MYKRQGYKNKQLGHNLKLHPVSGVAGKFSEEQKPWAGTMQGIHSDDNLFRKDNYGYLLEGLPMHPSLFFPFFPNNTINLMILLKVINIGLEELFLPQIQVLVR